MHLLHNLAITLLGIYPTDIKICLHKNLTNVWVSLFIVVKTWKQLKCSIIGKWLNNVCASTQLTLAFIFKTANYCYTPKGIFRKLC